MKLDFEYLETVLEAVESGGPHIRLSALADTLSTDLNSEQDKAKLGCYLRLLGGAGFLHSTDRDLGLPIPVNSNVYVCNSGSQLELTLTGHQFLETLRNESWRDKVSNYLKEMGECGLKSAPGFVIGLAANHIFGGT